jgi:transcriptional regulator with XRE-family HTH domain
MFGSNIKKIRESLGLGVNELSRLSGVNASYISALERDEKKNPSVNTLEKLATALNVPINEIMDNKPLTKENLEKWDAKSEQLREEVTLYETGEFETPQAAAKFLLEQPSIMGFGGFDIKKMTDEEIMEFANELLNQLKLLGYKYKK